MNVQRFQDANAFLAAAQDFLERAEATNGLALGICGSLQRGAGRGRRRQKRIPYLATVSDGDEIVLTAVSINRRYILSSYLDAPETAVAALVADMAAYNAKPINLRGVAPVADAFVKAWHGATGQMLKTGMRQVVWELREVKPPAKVNGRLRLADADDFYLVRDWAQGFQQEALGEDDKEAAHLMVQQFIQFKDLYVWEDETAVSMAAKMRPTRHGIAISLVYTPPDKRGLGYASSCVAALSQLLLDEGRQFTTLFTDKVNPTSNHIYEAVGYQPLADYHEYLAE